MEKNFDLVIKNGNVIDGTGNPWFKADIGISQGKIKKICFIEKRDARKIIDAGKMVVSPGFIDSHTHADYTCLLFQIVRIL